MSKFIPEREINPRSLGGVFLDGEVGPGSDLAGGEVLDFDGGADGADEADGVAELLLPRDFRGFRVGCIGGHGGAFELQLQLQIGV